MNLPASTKLNKKLKTQFEKNIKNGRKLLAEVKSVNLIHKLSSDTINIPHTPKVKEILIIELSINKKELPKQLLKNITIPNIPVLFNIKYEDNYAYAISLLDEQRYFFIDFDESLKMSEFNFSGVNLEKVYENIVKKFLKNIPFDSSISLVQAIQNDTKISTLKKEIKTLQNKIKKEKQFKKQLSLSRELKPKEEELKGLQQWTN